MSRLRFIEIAANLVDSMYSGVYHGSKKHEPDLHNVLQRSWNAGIEKIIITGTNLDDSKKGINISENSDRLFCTVGCHPTNCKDIATSEDPDLYLNGMKELVVNNRKKVVAIGEFGLDYDRLQFCPKEIQLTYFEKQLVQFSSLKLPLFLHCRNAAEDFIEILTRHREHWSAGVVHSFDGTEEQAKQYIAMGLYIGINGCSLKTEENLNVVKNIPMERILLETDCPWCEVRPTHAGFKHIKTFHPSVKKEKWQADKMVKGRNEPVNIRQVLEIIAGIKEEDLSTLAEQIFNNTETLFFSSNTS